VRAPSQVYVLELTTPVGGNNYVAWEALPSCGASVRDRTACTVGSVTDEWTCLRAGCCFDERAAPGVMNCFEADLDNIAFRVAGESTAFATFDYLGTPRGMLQAVNGIVTANLSDGPTYFIAL
jgi:hypothetical protein